MPPTTKNFIRLSGIEKILEMFSFKSNNGTEAVSFLVFESFALFEVNRTSVTDKSVVHLSGMESTLNRCGRHWRENQLKTYKRKILNISLPL